MGRGMGGGNHMGRAQGAGTGFRPTPAPVSSTEPSVVPSTAQMVAAVERLELCRGCSACMAVCPTEAVDVSFSGGAIAVTIDTARCTGCGTCVEACRFGVLDLVPREA